MDRTAPETRPAPRIAPGPDAFEMMAPHVDAEFYCAHNPDIVAAGADPAEHYWNMGWREGRDPNPWFHTGYYLRANPDVTSAGVNPLWHFVAQGRQEGRATRPQGRDAWRDELNRAAPDSGRPAIWTAPSDVTRLGADVLRALLATACTAARGIVIAFSHDRYNEVPGGTQLLVADEQRKFNGDLAAYLHLSPVEVRQSLAPACHDPHWLNVILDGRYHGIVTADAAIAALDSVPAALPRILAVHTLHGHRPETVAAIAHALGPSHAFYWVHDYGSACPSPRLLRNDIAFCNAPPPDSLACRVCIHGEDRRGHLSRMRSLFQAVPFHVVAPSQAALSQWQRAATLPARRSSVHPHVRLAPLPAALEPAIQDGPVRVAFVGQPVHAKGWGVFRELVDAACDLGCYRFFQFASAQELAPSPGVTAVAAETSAARPFGMVQALAAHAIDLVVAASPWPETFGYAAHEALASGADLVALAGTGNIAETVRAQARGVVLDDADALIAFFTSLRAAEYASGRRVSGRPQSALIHCGSTATIDPDGAPEPNTADPDLHLLVDGRRLEGVRLGDDWRFALQAATPRTVRLRSRHVLPLWESASGADPRRLGVAVTALILDGIPVPPGDVRRESGWHDAEGGWQWTDGDAVLAVGAARVLEITLVPLARYWRSPLFGSTPP